MKYKQSTDAVLLCLILRLPLFAGAEMSHSIKSESFGAVDGNPVTLYTLTNGHGVELRVTNYGCIVVSQRVPDKKGRPDYVVLGFDNLAGYLHNTPFFGALVVRYANRVAKARFTLDGVKFFLVANDGQNTIHGTIKGFNKVVWKADPVEDPEGDWLFTYTSKNGEEGFPARSRVLSEKLRQEHTLRGSQG